VTWKVAVKPELATRAENVTVSILADGRRPSIFWVVEPTEDVESCSCRKSDYRLLVVASVPSLAAAQAGDLQIGEC
jgi:hypothetical protein